jgi:hypothetical protein
MALVRTKVLSFETRQVEPTTGRVMKYYRWKGERASH